ncbi:hypothetical protein KSP40_PGU017862 [Platanthera guangdongensis]|uniref:Uncharacterized protein n=1 Tax=Platanthera guangdongensis TaxID=2320717 RepID=A0ABR2MV13_9ASPA
MEVPLRQPSPELRYSSSAAVLKRVHPNRSPILSPASQSAAPPLDTDPFALLLRYRSRAILYLSALLRITKGPIKFSDRKKMNNNEPLSKFPIKVEELVYLAVSTLERSACVS